MNARAAALCLSLSTVVGQQAITSSATTRRRSTVVKHSSKQGIV